MISIPEAFVASMLRLDSPRAKQWLAELPALVEACCWHWALDLDGAPMHGGLSLVVPVRRAQERCVLKLAHVEADAVHEARALAAWDGRGAVRLLDVEPSRGALLLERLDPARSTRGLPTADAFVVTGQLLRRLAVPAPPNTPPLRELAARLAAELPSRWERLGQPVAEGVLLAACRIAAALGPHAGDLLIHSDLYDDNILAGEREPWLAIDPRAVAGDPEFGVAPMVIRRLDELTGPTQLRDLLAAMCAAGGLDAELAKAWTLLRCVDYWLWGLSIGLTEDPARCARVVPWLSEL